MIRAQLEHIIPATDSVAGDDDILVVGSQSLLEQFPDAPEEFLISLEADVVPLQHLERSDLIDAAIGDGSQFEVTVPGLSGLAGISPTASGWKPRSCPRACARD